MIARRHLPSDALSLVGLIVIVFAAHAMAADPRAVDVHAYWVADYAIAHGSDDAFVYPPPAYLVAQLAGALPWPVFREGYAIANAILVWVLAGPLTIVAAFVPHVVGELRLGNVHILLGFVAVMGMRWPALWSIALLTKVTPGIGVLYFAFAGEWRKLAIALGVTAAIALPTLILAPGLWAAWLGVLTSSPDVSGSIKLAVRLPIAVAILFVGARRGWPWVVPIASMLALPVVWIHSPAMLVGLAWYLRRIGPIRLPLARPVSV
jgi:hypothetical protein